MGFPKGYDPANKLPITGGKRLPRTNKYVVVKGLWKKPKLNLSWLRRAVISRYGHGVHEKKHCVMEAFAIATGQQFGDSPICVSSVITQTLISANDTRPSDAERAKFKKVLPLIMGTAPIKVVRKYGHLWEAKDINDPAYQEVERRRRDLEITFNQNKEKSPDGHISRKVATKDIIALVTAMAELKPKRALKVKHSKASKKVQRSIA